MSTAFDEMIAVAQRLGIVVRHVHLGGGGGGMAKFKNQRQLFIDLDADPEDQIERTAKALANEPGLDGIFLRPDVRELIDDYRNNG